MPIEVIGALVTVVLICKSVLLLRIFHSRRNNGLHGYTSSFDAVVTCYNPMQRLLDPAEFRFLREHRVSNKKVNQLRSQRRKLYRLYLHSLRLEFERIHQTLKMCLVSSRVDRPEVAALLMKQKVAFYQNILRAELRLTLHALGFEEMPQIDFLAPLEIIRAQLQSLTSATAGVAESALMEGL